MPYNKQLTKLTCSGPHWEISAQGRFLYGPRYALSVLPQPWANITQYAWPSLLVSKRFISINKGANTSFSRGVGWHATKCLISNAKSMTTFRQLHDDMVQMNLNTCNIRSEISFCNIYFSLGEKVANLSQAK